MNGGYGYGSCTALFHFCAVLFVEKIIGITVIVHLLIPLRYRKCISVSVTLLFLRVFPLLLFYVYG